MMRRERREHYGQLAYRVGAISTILVIVGGTLLVGSSFFTWSRESQVRELDGLGIDGFVLRGPAVYTLAAGMISVAVGLIGLRWTLVSGLAVLPGLGALYITLFYTRFIWDEARGYEPGQAAPRPSAALIVGMCASVLVTAASTLSISGALVGKVFVRD